jgi:hypothetical protein
VLVGCSQGQPYFGDEPAVVKKSVVDPNKAYVTWPRPLPAKKNNIEKMINYHNGMNLNRDIEFRAKKIKEYLSGQLADQLPLTVSIGSSLIYTKPIPAVFKKGESLQSCCLQ